MTLGLYNLNHIKTSQMFLIKYTSGMNMWYILYSYQNERNKYLRLITKNTSQNLKNLAIF